MPAFSFSAPRFSAEDEIREQATLTEDEQLQIANDLTGNSNVSHPAVSAEDLHFALEQFHSELGLIPDDKKSSVLHAMREVPELVQRESSPMLFLRAEAFDSKAAAWHFVKYWNMRQQLFEDIFLLPMTLEGALRNDHDNLSLGMLENLPNDKHGRLVFYYERCRWNRDLFSRKSMLRIHFYVVSVSLTSTIDVIWLANFRGYSLEHFDRKLGLLIAQTINECLPISIKANHFCYPTESRVWNLLVPIFKSLMGKRLRHRTLIHVGMPNELIKALEGFGIDCEGLPVSIGGNRPHQKYHEWLDERRRLESDRLG